MAPLTMGPRILLSLSPSSALRFTSQTLRTVLRRHGAAAFYSSTSSGPLIRVTDLPAPGSGHIRILELNRPEARNAISKALLASLREEIDAVHEQYDPVTGEELPKPSWAKRFGGVAGEDERGPTRALIIASAVDTCFCAGADLKERKGFTQEEYVFPGLDMGSWGNGIGS